MSRHGHTFSKGVWGLLLLGILATFLAITTARNSPLSGATSVYAGQGDYEMGVCGGWCGVEKCAPDQACTYNSIDDVEICRPVSECQPRATPVPLPFAAGRFKIVGRYNDDPDGVTGTAIPMLMARVEDSFFVGWACPLNPAAPGQNMKIKIYRGGQTPNLPKMLVKEVEANLTYDSNYMPVGLDATTQAYIDSILNKNTPEINQYFRSRIQNDTFKNEFSAANATCGSAARFFLVPAQTVAAKLFDPLFNYDHYYSAYMVHPITGQEEAMGHPNYNPNALPQFTFFYSKPDNNYATDLNTAVVNNVHHFFYGDWRWSASPTCDGTGCYVSMNSAELIGYVCDRNRTSPTYAYKVKVYYDNNYIGEGVANINNTSAALACGGQAGHGFHLKLRDFSDKYDLFINKGVKHMRVVVVGQDNSEYLVPSSAQAFYDNIVRSEAEKRTRRANIGGGNDIWGYLVGVTGQYSLTPKNLVVVTVNGNGVVTGEGINCPAADCSETYNSGPAKAVSLVPAPNFKIKEVTGCQLQSDNRTCLVTLDNTDLANIKRIDVRVTYEEIVLTAALNVKVNGQGTITAPGISCPDDCTESYPTQDVTLTFTPAAKHYLDSVSGCNLVGNTCVVSIVANPIIGSPTIEVSATFKVICRKSEGDANCDGLVNAADYPIWREQYGRTGAQSADFNLSEKVDLTDYEIWRSNTTQLLGHAPVVAQESVGSYVLGLQNDPHYIPQSSAILHALNEYADVLGVFTESDIEYNEFNQKEFLLNGLLLSPQEMVNEVRNAHTSYPQTY